MQQPPLQRDLQESDPGQANMLHKLIKVALCIAWNYANISLDYDLSNIRPQNTDLSNIRFVLFFNWTQQDKKFTQIRIHKLSLNKVHQKISAKCWIILCTYERIV